MIGYFRMIRSDFPSADLLFFGHFFISLMISTDERVSALRIFSISRRQASFSFVREENISMLEIKSNLRAYFFCIRTNTIIRNDQLKVSHVSIISCK